MRKLSIIAIFCVLFAGCTKNRLSVQHFIETSDERASVFVGSPDPEKESPGFHLLYVQWNLPASTGEETYLTVDVLFGNMTIKQYKKNLTRKNGSYSFRIREDELQRNNGILTYKADVKRGQRCIAEWKDLMWFPLITRPTDNQRQKS